MADQIHLTDEQATALAAFIQDNIGGGGGLLLTRQGGGAIIAATDLATATITADGEVDEA